MTREQRDLVHHLLRESPLDLGADVHVQRPLLDAMLTAHRPPPDVITVPGTLGDVPAVFIDIADVEAEGVILFVHGGCFALGSAAASVSLAADLARRAHMRAVTIDYRLAPEHPFPAALDDVTAAYRELLEREPTAGRIAIAGESAGANLAAAALVAIRDSGLPLPSAAALLSPWADLSVSGDSMTTKADVDPKVTAEGLRIRAHDYL
jgi:epsilon-lactone hydrolase